MSAYKPGSVGLRGLGVAIAFLLAILLAVRADGAAAQSCHAVPEVRAIETSLNRFWGLDARLCQADDFIREAAAHPGERMVRANRRWLATMSRQHGDWAVAGILAHEWGHLVQNQPYGTAAELQADCLAGAFMRASGFNRTEAFLFAELSFRNGDLHWTPYGHGTGSQREQAVLRGYQGFNSGRDASLDRICPIGAL